MPQNPRHPRHKIAIIRQRYTDYGGAERFTERALNALAQNGTELHILCRQWRSQDDKQRLEQANATPYQIQTLNPRVLLPWRRLRDAAFHRAVCRHTQQHPYDLIQSHERLACCDIYRAGDGLHSEWLKQRARVRPRWQAWLDTASPYHRYLIAQEKRLYQSPQLKAVICNSQLIAQQLRDTHKLSDEKIRVIYSAIDSNHYHPDKAAQQRQQRRDQLHIPADQATHLIVGSGYERKGVAACLHALAQTQDQHLIIIGKDRHQARYQALARRLNIAHRSHFIGPQQDVLPWYGAADSLLLPTLYDPFPNVTLEALASGLPVITTPQSGTCDLLTEGQNGYIRDALDYPGLAQAMHQATRPERRQAHAQAARQSVRHLTPEALQAQLLALYQELLDR